MNISTMITKNSVTVNFDGTTHTILATTPAYAKVIDCIKRAQAGADVRKEITALVSPITAIAKASKGAFQVEGGSLLVDGLPVHGELGRQVVEFMDAGLPFQPLIAFCRNLRRNPSFRAVAQLFSFLEKNKHPITEDGKFIAYKRVRAADSQGRMLDIHSGTFDNRPGSTLEMPRNKVNEDPTVTCSYGLHVANWDYAANHFGGPGDTMLEVEVDPADVVAIPNDYNEAKMRVCRYHVRSVVVNPNDNAHLVPDPNRVVATPGGVCAEYDCEDEDCDDEEDESEDCGACNCGGECEEEEEEEEDDEEDGDEEEEEVPFFAHSPEAMRKMSSDRLTRYLDRLEAVPSGQRTKAWHAAFDAGSEIEESRNT